MVGVRCDTDAGRHYAKYMMRFYHMLAEETADDLYRKIDALDAVINDGAATDGEKENAKSLKAKSWRRNG